MSIGKLKFYGCRWHLTIRNSVTGEIFSTVVPQYAISTVPKTGRITLSFELRSSAHKLPISFNRGYPSGYWWEIKSSDEWSDYFPARKPKLKHNEELISFTK